MIRGMHGLIYSSDAAATRAFFRDVLELPSVDVGEGWLVFDLPSADLGIHPTEGAPPAGTHDISFFCDDIHGTVAGLQGRGAELLGEVTDQGWGLVIRLRAPGGVTIMLYEPRYSKG